MRIWAFALICSHFVLNTDFFLKYMSLLKNISYFQCHIENHFHHSSFGNICGLDFNPKSSFVLYGSRLVFLHSTLQHQRQLLPYVHSQCMLPYSDLQMCTNVSCLLHKMTFPALLTHTVQVHTICPSFHDLPLQQ